MAEDVHLQDHYAELVESLDKQTATYGFIQKEYAEGLNKIISSLEDDYTSIGAGTEAEDIFYKALATKFEMLEDIGKESTYNIKSCKKEFLTLKERLDTHFKQKYDRPRLIGILRKEYPDISQSKLRKNDDLPSEQPFVSRFGSLNNAIWNAGLPTNEELTKPELEHQLIKKTHRINQDRDMLIETPSARQINEDPDLHNAQAYQEAFGTLEEAFNSASLSTIRELENEMEEWREIIYTPHSDRVPINEKDIAQKIN